MKKNNKFSIYYFLGLFFTISIMELLFFPSENTGNKVLSYDSFVQKVDSGLVDKVLILNEKIVGELKDTKSDSSEHQLTKGPAAPWRLRIKEIEEQLARQFTVVRLPNITDNELLSRLLKNNVQIVGKYESNALKNFFLNWILPILFFMALWGFIYKRMGPGNPMLSVGKNKAKILAETPENPVKF